jgi:hypothetical protein
MMITIMIAAIWAACFPGCRKSNVSLLDTCTVVVKLVTCDKSSTVVARTHSLKVSWQGAGVSWLLHYGGIRCTGQLIARAAAITCCVIEVLHEVKKKTHYVENASAGLLFCISN